MNHVSFYKVPGKQLVLDLNRVESVELEYESVVSAHMYSGKILEIFNRIDSELHSEKYNDTQWELNTALQVFEKFQASWVSSLSNRK